MAGVLLVTRVSKRKLPEREQKILHEAIKISGKVFDDQTLMVLVRFLSNNYFSSVDYPVAQGKEAMVFRCTRRAGLPTMDSLSQIKDERKHRFSLEYQMERRDEHKPDAPVKRISEPSYVALKVYKYETTSFRTMMKYVEGDNRFKHVKHQLRPLVQTWARKEFANLQTLFEGGVNVPRPIAQKENALIMEFLGENGVPYALLSEIVVEEPEKLYRKILSNMRKIHKAGLVHADLSEYNIIMKGQEPFFIDVSQSVLLDHPHARAFLESDVRNVTGFFRRRGVKDAQFDKAMAFVTGAKPQ